MKKNTILFTLFYLLFISCGSQSNLTYDKLNKLEPTHSIKNKLILEPIEKTIKILNKKNSLFNIVIVKIDSINYNKENIYIHPSNLQMEQLNYRLSKTEKLEPDGLIIINEYPILLYGDLNTFFDRKIKKIDILKTSKEIDLLIDIDPMYQHYLFHRDTILGVLNEYLIYKGESDNPNEKNVLQHRI